MSKAFSGVGPFLSNNILCRVGISGKRVTSNRHTCKIHVNEVVLGDFEGLLTPPYSWFSQLVSVVCMMVRLRGTFFLLLLLFPLCGKKSKQR